MKKNVLALSIAAMIGGLGYVGSASADLLAGTGGAGNLSLTTATQLDFAEGGIGHALLVPYYNAQNGNMTVVHVTNTDTINGKAVKVRFRGARNSDDVLDFQVFMSPGDVWTAAIQAGPTGIAEIVTQDGSCTLPKLNMGVPQPFETNRLSGAGFALPDQANNTREGYVEIFNMADIPPTPATLIPTTLFRAIKHVAGVAPPCTDALLNATLFNFTTEPAAVAAGFDTPTTGLVGDWYIINVAQTTTFSAGATAIRALTAGGANARGNFVHYPQNPNAALNVNEATADPLFRTADVFIADGVVPAVVPQIVAANYDLPDMSTPYFLSGAAAADKPLRQSEALSNSLAVTSIINQYANDVGISAKTDWTFSMPTRRYNVAANYAVSPTGPTSTNYRIFSDLSFGGLVSDERFAPANVTIEGPTGALCVKADDQAFYDREETSKVAGAVFSPGNVTKTTFCGEVSVLSFRDAGKSVLDASVSRQDTASGYVNGWSNVNVNNRGLGLPILGAAFIKLSNPSATPTTSGTFGITWPHRFTRP